MDGYKIIESSVPGLTSFTVSNGQRDIPGFIPIDDRAAQYPALGGCRISDKYDSLQEVVTDVTNLSKGMTNKSATARLELNGGKAVIYCSPQTEKNETLLRNFAQVVNHLDGAYITAKDSGTTTLDIDYLAQHTEHVVGLTEWSGDPSILTAVGTYESLMAAIDYYGENLHNQIISINGAAGSVARNLIFGLHSQDNLFHKDVLPGLLNQAKLVRCYDINNDGLADLVAIAESLDLSDKLHITDARGIYSQPADIFVPSALRDSINQQNIPVLKQSGVWLIGGPENNPLKDPEKDSQLLLDLDIVSLPHYVTNAGGVINVYFEIAARKESKPFNFRGALEKVVQIGATTYQTIILANKRQITPLQAADQIADEILQNAKNQ